MTADTAHNRFSYTTLSQLKKDLVRNRLELPLSEDLSILSSPFSVYGKQIPNRLCVLPMEGCDGTSEGAPGPLTYRRYRRFAQGGAGLLWLEACSVCPEGRANPRQLWLHKKNLDQFQRLVQTILDAAPVRPYTVLQLTHSGRYAKPDYDNGFALPAVENPYLDSFLPPHHRILTDEELQRLPSFYADSARLAKEAGFDAVDLKCCHRYLIRELLSAFTRPGRYGGGYKNRTRLLLEILDQVQEKAQGIDITLRMNAFDAIAYPYGFGVDQTDRNVPDLEEPIRLLETLRDRGVHMVAVSIGNPYYNPHVGRPYDQGAYIPPTSQLQDTVRILEITRALQQAVPQVAIVSTGMSWLREFAQNVAAGGIKEGYMTFAGFGRQAFAYPDFAGDIFSGGMERKKCCVCCSSCTTLMRCRSMAGCPVRDKEVYGPLLKNALEGKPKANVRFSEHI